MIAADAEQPENPFDLLPNELVYHILNTYLTGPEWHVIARNVCRRWCALLPSYEAICKQIRRCRWPLLARYAAAGALSCVQWADAAGLQRSIFYHYAARCAAAHGHLAVLQWCATEKRCLLDETVCAAAAGGGHLALLQWLRGVGEGAAKADTHAPRAPCPWDHQTVVKAARAGHLDVVRWAVLRGCAMTLQAAVQAAAAGHLRVVRWLLRHGCPADHSLCAHAAARGHLPVLELLRSSDCPLSPYVFALAARGGHMDVLRWLRAQGCPWDARVCSEAALHGHLEALQWARKHGCPWDHHVCINAASNGHFAVVRWAVAHGCPMCYEDWHEVVLHAAERGDVDMLCWVVGAVREHGYPLVLRRSEVAVRAARRGHTAVLHWLRAHARP
jgi:hypothetical protein